MESKIIALKQLINYKTFSKGNNPAIIFLHGWGSSCDAWNDAANRIDDNRYTSYCLDLPGFGKSPVPQTPFSVNDYVEIVYEFIKKMNLDKVVLVGHSFGGRIAIKFSAEYPETVKKVVLVDSAGLISNKSNVQRRKFVSKIAKPFFKPKFMHKLRSKIYESIGAEDYLTNPELKETFQKVLAEDLAPFLSKIASPTLIIWGAEDSETPLSDGEIMHEKIHNSKMVVLADAGHFSFIDQPDKFSEALINFVKQ